MKECLTMESSVVRTGLVGYGLAGKVFHAPFIEADPGFSLDAVVTADSVRSAQARADHPLAEVISGFNELLRGASDLDLVVLATPPRFHFDQARAALEAGLGVVVDKPFVLDSDEGERLISIAKSCGRPLMVFHNRRWDGDFLTIESIVRSGALGTVFQFESNFEHWAPAVEGQWQDLTPPKFGGGVTFDLGSHLIDQALQLFGPVESVRADVRTIRPGTRNDDVSMVELTHGSGVRSQLRMNRMAAQPVHRFRVLGTEAAYISYGLDGQEPALASGLSPRDPTYGETPADTWGLLGASGSASGPQRVPMARGDYPAFYAGVAQAVRGASESPVNPESALAVTRILEQVRATFRRD